MRWHSVKRRFVLYAVNHWLAGTRQFERKRKLLNSVGYEIGEGTKVVGPLFCTGKLKIGRDCWVGQNLTVHGNGTVEIGDRCDLAPDVAFLTGGHEIGDADRRAGQGESYDIRVGNGVWIGARATLGRSITVGDASVVAACACVMKDVENHALVGGVPAGVIRKLDERCLVN